MIISLACRERFLDKGIQYLFYIRPKKRYSILGQISEHCQNTAVDVHSKVVKIYMHINWQSGIGQQGEYSLEPY